MVAIGRVKNGRPSQSPILYGLRDVGKTVLLVHIKAAAESKGYKNITFEADERKILPQLLIPKIRKIFILLDNHVTNKERISYAMGVLKSFTDSVKFIVNDINIGITVNSEKGVADSGIF